MSKNNKIINCKKSKIDRLFDAINNVRPGFLSREIAQRWKDQDASTRKDSISTFLSMRNFSNDEIIQIDRLISKLIIPWKKLFYTTSLLIILSISYLFYQFKMLPRLYCIGSKIDMPDSKPDLFSNSNQIGLDNIGIFNGVLTTSKTTVLYEKIQGNKYEVKEDNFIKWIFGNQPSSLIDAMNFVQDKQSFSEYIKIFTPYIGLSDFEILSSADRKAIYNFSQKNSKIESLSDDFHKYKTPDSSFHILGKMQLNFAPDTTLIYIRFKMLDGNNKNYVLSHKNSFVSYIENGPKILTFNSSEDNFLFYQRKAKMVSPEKISVRDIISDSDFYIFSTKPFILNRKPTK